ncbi:ArsR family transcriptional regulator, partial [Halorubrum ezzemoulense]|nr:ArsR family transcriptional regulator [Halorubrum ezzemoulense]
MSIDTPTSPEAGIGTLPDPRIEDRVAPQPAAHGAAVQAVFNDAGRDLALYSAVHPLWYDIVGDRDEEPGIAAELDHHELTWLDAPTPGREWVVKLTSSRWKAGTGSGDDYSAYYKYDLTLRERDEDGDLYKPGKACSLRVITQFEDLNYKDGEPLTLQYDEGSLVRCSTTWADTSAEVEGRMLDLLEIVLDVDRGRLLADRN